MLAEVILQPHSSRPRNENPQFVWKWKLLPFNVALVRINSILNILPVSLGQMLSVFTVSTEFLVFLAMIICPNKNKSPDSGAEGFSGSSLTGAALNGNKCLHSPPPPLSNDLICNLVIGSRYHRTTVLSGAWCKHSKSELRTRLTCWETAAAPGRSAGRTTALLWSPGNFTGDQKTIQTSEASQRNQAPLPSAGHYMHCFLLW